MVIRRETHAAARIAAATSYLSLLFLAGILIFPLLDIFFSFFSPSREAAWHYARARNPSDGKHHVCSSASLLAPTFRLFIFFSTVFPYDATTARYMYDTPCTCHRKKRKCQLERDLENTSSNEPSPIHICARALMIRFTISSGIDLFASIFDGNPGFSNFMHT